MEPASVQPAAGVHQSGVGRPPELPNDLSEVHTVMAADRTLMSWIRTALAMLSLSFTLYWFLVGVKVEHELADHNAPQNIGLFLAGIGTLSITTGIFEYWSTLRDLNRMEKFRIGRPVLFVAVVLACAGIALFFSIALRLF